MTSTDQVMTHNGQSRNKNGDGCKSSQNTLLYRLVYEKVVGMVWFERERIVTFWRRFKKVGVSEEIGAVTDNMS